MIVSLTYFVMCAITIWVVFVSYRLAVRSSSLIPVVPIAAMYYWSLYGVWSWIPMKLSGGSSYTEDALFPINIDGYYLQSVIYYSLFIVVFSVFELHIVRERKRSREEQKTISENYISSINKLADRRWYGIGLAVLLLLFIYMWYRDLATAFSSGQSAYQVSRWETETGTAEYLSMFLGNLFIALAIPLLFVTNRKRKRTFYIAMVGIYYGMNFLLGNRSALLSGLVLAVIIFGEIYGLKRVFRLRNILLAVGCLFFIQVISIVRGLSVSALVTGDFHVSIGDVFQSLTGSSEKDAAQVSMYCTLKKDVPFTYGKSILFLMSTVIPSFVGIERPERVYTHYIDHILPSGAEVGMTINHVTAWYINLGVIGIIIGALVWGYTLRFFFVRRSKFLYMFGAALFSAAAIPMIRDGGIECYKGCLLLGTIFPMIFVWYFLKKYRMR